MDIDIRHSIPAERVVLEELAKSYTFVNEFVHAWTHWHCWEQYPPIIVCISGSIIGSIIGFLAVKYSKARYMNIMYIWTMPEYRGVGLARHMIDYALVEGACTRLRLRCHVNSAADKFWMGLGIVPYGATRREHFYDFAIDGITSTDQFNDKLCDAPTDAKILALYERAGVVKL